MPLISELMVKEVITIEPEADLQKAAELMAKKNIGRLVVVKGGAPVGVVTERDFLTKVVAKKKEPSSTTIAEIMSRPLITIEPSKLGRQAAKLMVDHNIRTLVVVEKESLVGILTIRDLTRAIVNTMASLTESGVLKREMGHVTEFET